MRNLRLLIPGLALLALGATGCFITSGQILAHFDLPSPFTISNVSNSLHREPVDLNTINDYADHKDKLKGLTDLALLGTFENVTGTAATVEVYITADHTTTYLNAADVIANGTKLWGPLSIAGPAGNVITLSWDDSAALFNSAGKQILIDEVKGDGQFAVHVIGTAAGAYSIQVRDAVIVLVLDAGI